MPAHVVANWLGHSVKVQNDSYAQVDDHHFERFNQTVANGGNQDTRNGTKRPKVATHVATSNPSKNADGQRVYTRNAFSGLAVEGLEPPTRGL